MGKFKEVMTNTKVLILIAALVVAVILINPGNDESVSIRGIVKDSTAAKATPPMTSPDPGVRPRDREILREINGIQIRTVKEYYDAIASIKVNDTFIAKTNKNIYYLTAEPDIVITTLNETETIRITEEMFNETTNSTKNVTRLETRNKTIETVVGVKDIGITVYKRPPNNIRRGLDLEGGTRVLLEPVDDATDADLELVSENIKRRLDVYGVSDVTVRIAKDFFGKSYITVEIAGVNEQEVKDLLSRQGKFEAKVGDVTVFRGGNNDILRVCRTADCSGLDPRNPCQQTAQDQWLCRFQFSITLSQDAAKKQADATRNLEVISESFGVSYLSKNLSLYLDDKVVDELRIGSDLKGNPVTDIAISGSGQGQTKKAATQDALLSMKQLQTVLVTGSLPVKLQIVKTDSISSALGEDFIKSALLAAVIAMLAVMAVIAIRYREWRVSVPICITIISEVILTLGFASLIGWRMDMAAIAAIIIAVGSGVNDQIVITDETLHGGRKEKEETSWKDRMKKAFFIVVAAYLTITVAMIPLWFAGAGLLKGFALTTIVGVTVGVLVTRPAFAEILELIVEER